MGIYVPIYLLLSNWKFVPIEPLHSYCLTPTPLLWQPLLCPLYLCIHSVLHWLFSTLIWKENAKL